MNTYYYVIVLLIMLITLEEQNSHYNYNLNSNEKKLIPHLAQNKNEITTVTQIQTEIY